MKILTICPSIHRPKFLKQLTESFHATSQCDNDLYVMQDSMTPTQCFNKAFEQNPTYDFYHMTNDDVIYHTPGWDKLLAIKGKISYGRDGIQDQNLCTFPMIDGDIVRAVGYLQHPTLCKYCGDNVWMEIGKYAKCLNYVPEVFIEHLHFLIGKRENDDKGYDANFEYDKRMFWNWNANESIADIKKVKGVLYGSK